VKTDAVYLISMFMVLLLFALVVVVCALASRAPGGGLGPTRG